jgi:succinate dehydrogenase / fumarate reductase flavoprotein subunit
MGLDSKIPAGPLADKWKNHKDHMNLLHQTTETKLILLL